jgi:KaiC/GvpD/RAD55 family RecA-like ATPase
MPNEEESPETITCPICGHVSPKGATRCEHCYSALQSEEQAQNKQPSGDIPQEEKELQELRQVPGVGEAKAETLLQAGYHSIKDLQKATVEDLSMVKGIGEKLAAKIIQGANELASGSGSPLANWLSGEDEGLSEWLSGDERAQPEATVANRDTPRDDSLARWLSGEEEDVSVWLEETRAPEVLPQQIGPNELLAREAEVIQLRETLREKLREFESGEFDPQATIEELAKVKGELEVERNKTKQLEEELENVKRGSIAVIKFIKSQQGSETDQSTLTDKLASEMANRETLELKIMQLEEVVSKLKEQIDGRIQELPPDSQELKRQEIALSERQAQLDAMSKQLLAKEEALSRGGLAGVVGGGTVSDAVLAQQAAEFSKQQQELLAQIQDLQSQLAQAKVELKQKEEMMKLSASPAKEVDKEVMRKLEDAQRLERTLVVREQEVQRLREDLRIREEELQKLKEPMKYKEDEMLRREEDLMYRERLLQEEMKKVAQSKVEIGSQDEITLKRRLEELKAEVNQKEEEVRAKEKYLAMKEEELKLREQGVISDEIEKREQDRLIELKQEKVKTGTARLDDLLMGGMPFGSNVLVYGPPFTGKEVMVSAFIAEGLKKGVPAMWILTEKSPKEIREEMLFVVSGYEEYEKLGLVRYVDAYSRSMGDESQDPYTDYIESPTDYESIQKAIETVAKKFKEKHEYYRVGFRSISTLIAYLDPGTAFRFLSPVVGRRKRDKAVAMYTIEKGVHGEQEIQMIGSLMDGMIEFKVENLNTFLAIRGICDVQSRAYIRYSATKGSVTIGSFSLDHIR